MDFEDSRHIRFNRVGLGTVLDGYIKGVDAVKKYPKLMVLGRPGSGKTTFLKYLALKCSEGLLFEDKIPAFVALRSYSETYGKPDLLSYISNQFIKRHQVGTSASDNIREYVLEALKAGKYLLLFDGLDEVSEENDRRVLNQIRQLSEEYCENHIVISCRIASSEYTFEKFTEVEIANFDRNQIKVFVNNWFRPKNIEKANEFIQELSKNSPLEELANSPLLLTLLCLVFEELNSFPPSRSELYEEGIDILLKKWDAQRGIERSQIYKRLSTRRKADLLSYIGYMTFKEEKYFFKRRDAQAYIRKYIENLSNSSETEHELELDSDAILKSIEAQHGLLTERAKSIYSFSHLTFHEYFAARKMISSNLIEVLKGNFFKSRWREVILLASEMMDSADEFISCVSTATFSLPQSNEKTLAFLGWLEEKISERVIDDSQRSPSAFTVRAYYFEQVIADYSKQARHFPITTMLLARNPNVPHIKKNEVSGAKDVLLRRSTIGDLLHITQPSLKRDEHILDAIRGFSSDSDISTIIHTKLTNAVNLNDSSPEALKILLDQLKIADVDDSQSWWKEQRWKWLEAFRELTSKHFNIGKDWKFTEGEVSILEDYHYGLNLLVELMLTDSVIAKRLRQQILTKLFSASTPEW